jgi:hypothetical protein
VAALPGSVIAVVQGPPQLELAIHRSWRRLCDLRGDLLELDDLLLHRYDRTGRWIRSMSAERMGSIEMALRHPLKDRFFLLRSDSNLEDIFIERSHHHLNVS